MSGVSDERVMCSVCRRRVGVNMDGTVRWHSLHGKPCKGSRQLPMVSNRSGDAVLDGLIEAVSLYVESQGLDPTNAGPISIVRKSGKHHQLIVDFVIRTDKENE